MSREPLRLESVSTCTTHSSSSTSTRLCSARAVSLATRYISGASKETIASPNCSERASAILWSSRVRCVNRYSPTSWISDTPMTIKAAVMISR